MEETVTIKSAGAIEEVLLLGEVHPFLQQLGTCDGLVTLCGLSGADQTVHDRLSLARFLNTYIADVLRPIELPAICRAHDCATKNQARELVALDQELARNGMPSQLEAASRRVGRDHIHRLRPLRDQRTVQRYLRAVDESIATGWHTIVYGITLAVYSLPVRQGLILYSQQTLAGFIRASARPLQLSADECVAMIEEVSTNLPPIVEQILVPR